MMNRRLAVVGVALLAWTSDPASTQSRPPEWRWPERAQKLEVLPKDFPPDRLAAVMKGFTRALGVRCQYCHVGKEGEPLSTFDFVSDQNPNKARAREMLRMLGSINDHLAKIEPSATPRVNMWCHTCHQGRPRPTTLEEELAQSYRQGKAPAAIARYHELRERYYGRGGYDFGERSLNEYGYRLLKDGDREGALALLKLNAELFPASANAHDSLAEAYLAAGGREQARASYRKSLELDPGNSNARRKLEEMAAEEAKKPPAEKPPAD